MMIDDEAWLDLERRLSRSRFRSRFHLKDNDKQYVLDKGYAEIEAQCIGYVRKRLLHDMGERDGSQCPMKGHPVFIACHATALCCRGCMEKTHGIMRGHDLTEDEIEYIVSVIMRFISKEMEGYRSDAVQGLLF